MLACLVMLSALTLALWEQPTPTLASAQSVANELLSTDSGSRDQDSQRSQKSQESHESEQSSDSNESSHGEESPEFSDGEATFAHPRGSLPAAHSAHAMRAGALPPVLAITLRTQFRPDGLERPPRA